MPQCSTPNLASGRRRGQSEGNIFGDRHVGYGSLASDLTCQRHVRLDRDLGHSGGTGEEFRADIQRSVDKGWLANHESGTYVKFTRAGAELFA
jgi:hypothetical protein